MNNLSVDCDCDSSPAAPEMQDIGILASADPVALEQVCLDLVYAVTPADGNNNDTKAVTTIGKIIFSFFDTLRSCVMTISRSFLVVSAFMIGGWITGTNAM